VTLIGITELRMHMYIRMYFSAEFLSLRPRVC